MEPIYGIKHEDAQKILNYLSSRPYQEVFKYVEIMRNLPTVQFPEAPAQPAAPELPAAPAPAAEVVAPEATKTKRKLRSVKPIKGE